VVLIALVSLDFILILSLCPSVKLLHKFEVPVQDLSECLVPNLAWGRTTTVQSLKELRDNPVIAISWGGQIQLF